MNSGVSYNMTRDEVIRAAEHEFPNPTPLIAMMLAYINEDSDRELSDVNGVSILRNTATSNFSK